MDDGKRVYKFNGEPSEDFRVWKMRTEAALEAKEVLSVVMTDVIGDGSTEVAAAVKLSVAKARATIIQGLGEKPVRLCMPVKDNPYKMWQRLQERYAVVNMATKVQLQTQLSRITYKGERMTDYVSLFEQLFNRLSGMGSKIEEDMQVAMLLASFGNKNSSTFGHVIASLQSGDNTLSWETATAWLLQEYDEQEWASSTNQEPGKTEDTTTALTANGGKRPHHSAGSHHKKRGKSERRRCFGCGKRGHIVKNCPDKGKGNKDHSEDESSSWAHHAIMMMALSDAVKNELMLDSGSSDHMINRPDWLFDTTTVQPRFIVLGNGSTVISTLNGSMKVDVLLTGSGPVVKRATVLRDILYVPELEANLISCSKLCQAGYEMTFRERKCVALLDGKVECQGKLKAGVFVINGTAGRQHDGSAFAARSSGESLWHDRLGHAHCDSIRELARKEIVEGLNLKNSKVHTDMCESCVRGKLSKFPMHSKDHRSDTVGEVIHSDVCGPMQKRSLGGSSYFVTFIDEKSGYKVVVPIARKSDVLNAFRRFHVWFERRFNCKIKRLQCDGGGEYIGCKPYLEEHGIEMNDHPPYSPELNDMAERTNRTLLESARSMLFHAKMPKEFWAEAVSHAADIRNRFLHPRDSTKSSYEILTGKKPRVDHLRVFGSTAWIHVAKEKRRKLDEKSVRGIVVGGFENSIYKVWLGPGKEPVVSRHLKIIENKFPDSKWYAMATVEDEEERLTVDVTEPTQTPLSRTDPTVHHRQGDTITPDEQDSLTYVPTVPTTFGKSDDEASDVGERSHPDVNDEVEDSANKDGSAEATHSRYPSRHRKKPSFYGHGSALLVQMSDEPATVEEALVELRLPNG